MTDDEKREAYNKLWFDVIKRVTRPLWTDKLPRWFKRIPWVHKWLVRRDIKKGRFIYAPYVPMDMPDIVLEDFIKKKEEKDG